MVREELASVFAKQNTELKNELEEVPSMVKVARDERDIEFVKLLQEQKDEMEKKVLELQLEGEKLRVSVEGLYAKRVARLEKTIKEQKEATERMMSSLEAMKLDTRKTTAEEERQRRQNAWEQRLRIKGLPQMLSSGLLFIFI
jgi:hypothetical protein